MLFDNSRVTGQSSQDKGQTNCEFAGHREQEEKRVLGSARLPTDTINADTPPVNDVDAAAAEGVSSSSSTDGRSVDAAVARRAGVEMLSEATEFRRPCEDRSGKI